jgi:hypothetical protein
LRNKWLGKKFVSSEKMLVYSVELVSVWGDRAFSEGDSIREKKGEMIPSFCPVSVVKD